MRAARTHAPFAARPRRPAMAAAPRKKLSPFIRNGLPLILFCGAGYLGLSVFVQGVYAKRDARVVRRSERAVALADAHRDIVGKLTLDADKLQLKPIHRPREA